MQKNITANHTRHSTTQKKPLLITIFAMLFLMNIVLCACSSLSEKEPLIEEETPVEKMYNDAANALDNKDYIKAAELFAEVERVHPYSKWATKAQMMGAYAYFEADKYDDAIIALDRFIDLHPGSEDIDYAYYLKAMAYYEQISDVVRDQQMTMDAMNALNTLIKRFPDSKYARSAKMKLDLTRDHLAGKEMEIGRYYLKRGEMNAAINRFRNVVTDYQTTTHVPEALHRLVEAYMTIGLKSEATKVAAVLGYNYPGSKWYERTYKIMDPEMRKEIQKNKNLIDKTVDSLFKR